MNKDRRDVLELRKNIGRHSLHPFEGAATHQPGDCAYVDPPAARQLRELPPSGGQVPNPHQFNGGSSCHSSALFQGG